MLRNRRTFLAVVAALAILLGSSLLLPRRGQGRLRAAAPRACPAPSPADRPGPPIALPTDGPTGMAGEFEPQSAILLGCNELVRFHEAFFVDFVAATHESVRLIGLLSDGDDRRAAEELLGRAGLDADAIELIELPVLTMWVRDYGPLFTRDADGKPAIVDADTSTRGGQLDPADGDDSSPRLLAEMLGLRCINTPARIEGGNLLTNGRGLVVSTTTLAAENLDPPAVTALESTLADDLGLRRWVYLRPLEGEPTGHVDMFVAFVAPNVAVVGQMDPDADARNAAILDEAAELLAREQTPLGPMEVHRVDMPAPAEGVWLTYTNVVFANGTLLVPSYTGVDARIETRVRELYATLLPGWTIKPLACDSVIELGGAMHCLTMNIPAFVHLPAGLAGRPAMLSPGARDLRPTRPRPVAAGR